MPDDDNEWLGDDRDDEADSGPEPGVFRINEDDIDPATGRAAGDSSTAASDPARDTGVGAERMSPSWQDDVHEASSTFEPPAFSEPGADEVDELFSHAIANQIAGQEHVVDMLEDLRVQLLALTGGVEEVRGDLATQFAAQSSHVDSNIEQRLARLEDVVGEVSANVAATRTQLSEDIGALQLLSERGGDGAGVVAGDDLVAAVDATREATLALQRRIDELESEQRSLVSGQVGELRASMRDELHAQAALIEQLLADVALDGGDSADAVAQLRGTIAALADDVADVVAGSAAGVTRADIEGLEHTLASLANRSGSGDVSSVRAQLAGQADAMEMISDAIRDVSQGVEALVTERQADEESRRALDELIAQQAQAPEQLSAEIRATLEEATGTVADALVQEGSDARRQLREAINRVRSLEASLVNYLVERDERIANERAHLTAAFVAQLAEGLSRRDRKRIARQLSESELLEFTEPRRPVPSPDADGPGGPITPSQRDRSKRLRERHDQEPASVPPRPDEPPVGPEPVAPEPVALEPTDASEAEADVVADQAPVATTRAPSVAAPAAPKRPASRGGRPGTDEDREVLGRVKGVGPARQDQLLEAFGTLSAIAAASPDELAAIPGVSDRLARDIRRVAKKASA